MNWVDFFNDNQIEYITRGPNTARDHISIRCPWCGEDDPSQHLGISLTSGFWGCLRNAAHRGKSPVHLISSILGCGSHQARLVVAQYSESDPESLGLNQTPHPTALPEALLDTRAIKPMGSTAKFWHYLERRNFRPEAAIHEYTLSCCLTGRFKDRLIIPLFRDGEMIAWTGRALITPITAPRYLSSQRVKETIFNEDVLFTLKSDLLFVCEGPFDAMKLDHYGWHYGARATCCFGTSISMDQVVLLNRLTKRYSKVVVLFDQGAIEQSFAATDWLQAPNVSMGALPEGVKDPGELHPEQVQELIQTCR